MKIVLHNYTANWPQRFAAERDRLLALPLPACSRAEHIGSTSVPGLAAKDIIDIMIGLPDFEAYAADVVPRIVALGYVYLPKYEDVMPFRRFFYFSENEMRRFHIHMVGIGTTFWQEHLLFRDHLRALPGARLRYEALKRDLAEREWTGMNDYADAKGEFIRTMVTEAKATCGPGARSLIEPAAKPSVVYCDWDPAFSAVVRSLIDALTPLPHFLNIEHVGSTAIAGCGGKGVIDLLALYRDGRRDETKSFLLGMGFVSQGPEFSRRWPDERPMYLGRYKWGDNRHLIYVHIIDEKSDEVRRFRTFRDRLSGDASLVAEYCALKRQIIAEGVTDTDDYAVRKRASCTGCWVQITR